MRNKGFMDFDFIIFVSKFLIIAIVVIAGLLIYKSYREKQICQDAKNLVISLAEFYKTEFPEASGQIDLIENYIVKAIDNTEKNKEVLFCIFKNRNDLLEMAKCVGKENKRLQEITSSLESYLKR